MEINPQVPSLEPFDEFETLHYFLKHYYIGFGGINVDVVDFYPNLRNPRGPTEFVRKTMSVAPIDVGYARSNFGFARVDERAFLIGGFGFDNFQNAHHRRLDTILETDMNNGIKDSAGIEAVMSIQAVSIGTFLVTFGGRTSPNKPSSTLKVYEVRDKCEEIMRIENDDFALYRAAVAQDQNGAIWCFGGRTFDGRFTANLTKIDLDIEARTCAREKVSNPFPPLASAALKKVSDSEFMLVGGLGESGAFSNLGFIFEIEGAAVKMKRTFKMPFGIYGHQLEVLEQDRILLIGGMTDLPLENDIVIQYSLTSEKAWVYSITLESGKEDVRLRGR
jgi:hypothetical protein